MNPIQVITTADGSGTIYVPDLNEQYHSVNGAVTESMHVFIKNGLQCFCHCSELTILEIGFGTGLNALLTADYALNNKVRIAYYGLEKYPLGNDLIDSLDYGKYAGGDGTRLFKAILGCNWEELIEIHPYFKLKKLCGDLMVSGWENGIRPDLVYFDAFGPDKQPGMWSEEVFRFLSGIMNDNGVLVTYSAKGEVRRRLISAGFKAERLPGPPGKREMLRARVNREE